MQFKQNNGTLIEIQRDISLQHHYISEDKAFALYRSIKKNHYFEFFSYLYNKTGMNIFLKIECMFDIQNIGNYDIKVIPLNHYILHQNIFVVLKPDLLDYSQEFNNDKVITFIDYLKTDNFKQSLNELKERRLNKVLKKRKERELIKQQRLQKILKALDGVYL